MATFGEILRAYRLRSFAPYSARALSQEQLAELLAAAIGIDSISGSTISNWERGKYQIHKDDRAALVGLVKVLHHCGGIPAASAADEFLLAGNYRSLDREERRQINPAWVENEVVEPASSLFPLTQFRETRLPPPSYTRLFGVDSVVNMLCDKLKKNSAPWVTSIVGLGGMGKTAVADAVARRLIRDAHFQRIIWLAADSLTAEPPNQQSNSSFDAWTLALGEKLLPQGLDRAAPERRLMQVRHLLKQCPSLVVIDNVESEKHTAELLDQLNDLAQPSKFLLTSRYHPPPAANVFVFQMKRMSTIDALTLLRHQASIVGVDFSHFSDVELLEICELVGGHPLALRSIPKLAMIQSLPQIRAGLRQRQSGHFSRLYQAIYEQHWQMLSLEEKELMRIMRLVAPTGAWPEQLLAMSGLDEDQFWPIITTLVERCLVELRGTIHERRYGVHNLTEQFLHRCTFGGQPAH